ncbi:MAG: alpha/beta hydrolase [Marinisporobacter sp.]|jgi:pimeloyl-[acyl-carrier protein] methyl ester esterase|nr:alpha/beta hydrolase [Marinisporobacter sp.]
MKKYLVILSGWGVDEFVWKPIVDFFKEEFEVFILTWEKIGVIDEFKNRFIDLIYEKNMEQFSIIGWSLGSLVAIDLYKDFSSKIEHMILFNATAKFIQDENYFYGWNKKIVDRMIYMLKGDHEKTLKKFYKNLFSRVEVDNGYEKKFLDEIKKIDTKKDIKSLLIGLEYLKDQDLRECLKEIDGKILLIHGEKDSICPIQAGEYLKNHIKKAKMVVLKKAGHMILFTKPDECYKIIKNYIKEGRNS